MTERRVQYQINGKPAEIDWSIPGGMVIIPEGKRLERITPEPHAHKPRRVSRKPVAVRKGRRE